MMGIGDIAPDFEAQATNGKPLRLHALRPSGVVLYFFHKAFTPNCSLETRLFADHHGELTALGFKIVGVSTDNLERQCDFARARGAGFPMVGDDNRQIAKTYGVLWGFLPITRRVTYVLDAGSVVQARFCNDFRVTAHLDSVLAWCRERSGAGLQKVAV